MNCTFVVIRGVQSSTFSDNQEVITNILKKYKHRGVVFIREDKSVVSAFEIGKNGICHFAIVGAIELPYVGSLITRPTREKILKEISDKYENVLVYIDIKEKGVKALNGELIS